MADNEFPAIPGYRITKQLGRGGMAVVFFADQERLDRPVAIKVMRPEIDADGSFGERFLREARIVAKLSHPNILAIYDVGTAGAYHYMSMELVPGGDLKSRIRRGPIAVADALSITRQIAAALHFAHQHGYVHRDVKPENVLFRADGTAVLSDFGIARAANDAVTRMTATGAVIGTPSYMSPEQVQGHELDGRSDIYSLGVMFFELLAGHIPYQGDSAVSVGIKHLRDPVPELPAAHRRYQGLINRMLAKLPEQRFQTGAEIVQAIDAAERAPHVDAHNAETQLLTPQSAVETELLRAPPVAATPPPATTTRSRSPVIGIAAGLAVTALAAAGYYIAQPGEPSAPSMPIAQTPEPAPGATQPNAAEAAAQLAMQQEAERRKAEEQEQEQKRLAADEQARRDEAEKRAAAAEQAKRDEDARRAATEREQQRIAAEEKAKREDERRAAEQREQQRIATEQEQKRIADEERKKREETDRRTAEQERLRLAALEKSRQEEADRRARDEQLKKLLSQARDYLDGGQLSDARVARAHDLYRDAQRLAPADERAQEGPRLVADAYAALARTRTDAKRYDEAETLVLKGLEVVPDHGPLLALQKTIAEKRNAKKSQQRTLGGF